MKPWVLVALLLTACAAKVTTSGRTVVVRAGFPDMGVEKALALAEAECGKRNQSATVRGVTTRGAARYIFECQ